MAKTSGKALYQKIYEELRDAILGKTVPGGSYLPSERELCDRFGVDRITVRRSLEMLVGDGLVEKRAGVGTYVKEFPLKSRPVENRMNVLFVLPKDRITESYNTALFYEVEKECKANGYSLIYSTLGTAEGFQALCDGNNISGVLLVGKFTDKQYEDCLRTGLPAVVVNNCQEGFVSIDSDNEEGAYAAVDYLCNLGHERIGVILGEEGFVVTRDRMKGYQRALTDHGIDWRQQVIGYGDWTFDKGFSVMTDMLNSEAPPPTAVFAMNDLTAIGAMEAVREQGLSVPGDIGIVGFDNVEQCEYVRPKLTSVDANIGTIAKVAIAQLKEKIDTGNSLSYRVMIPPWLVVRESARNLGRKA
jgi:DNA-binding LacI/PurR family transcriptional regulator